MVDSPLSNPQPLYFFKENQQYLDWLANDPTLKAKLDNIFYSPRSHREARRMLRHLFKAKFIDQLAAGDLPFTDPKTGDSVMLNEVDLADSLYNLYAIAPGLHEEGTWHFDKFVPRAQARWFAYVTDAFQFYQRGPSFAGETITFEMANVLLADFFAAEHANCSASGAAAADLRFAHAETIMPFAALLELPNSDQQVPASKNYRYRNNRWRGKDVSPFAANIQWDSFSDANGACIVRMLYNEKQMRFKADCKSIGPKSFYYSLDELDRCYGV